MAKKKGKPITNDSQQRELPNMPDYSNEATKATE